MAAGCTMAAGERQSRLGPLTPAGGGQVRTPSMTGKSPRHSKSGEGNWPTSEPPVGLNEDGRQGHYLGSHPCGTPMQYAERKTNDVPEMWTIDDEDTGRLVDLLPVRDFPACVDAVDPACPRCAADLTRTRRDWRACPQCDYEMDADAVRLYQLLSAAYEAQPKEFFDWVQRRRDRLRDEEPVWQRRR